MTGRLRVAMFSPLPPLSSGIADYCVELLPHLAERFDLEWEFHDHPTGL